MVSGPQESSVHISYWVRQLVDGCPASIIKLITILVSVLPEALGMSGWGRGVTITVPIV